MKGLSFPFDGILTACNNDTYLQYPLACVSLPTATDCCIAAGRVVLEAPLNMVGRTDIEFYWKNDRNSIAIVADIFYHTVFGR